MSTAHHLILEHRGAPHVHVHKPTCICGWAGVPRRRQREAVAQYRDHMASLNRRASNPKPRTLTPTDQLPKELR